jgi:hypothetical protein
VNNVFPLLRSSSTIFQSCFGFNLDGDIDTVNSAATDRNIDLFTETARRIESAVLSSFKSRPFKFEPPVEQIKG